MAGGKTPPILTPHLASWETVLRAYRYPLERWEALIEGATWIHDLSRRQDGIGWVDELGMELDDVTPEILRRWAEHGTRA